MARLGTVALVGLGKVGTLYPGSGILDTTVRNAVRDLVRLADRIQAIAN